MINTRILEQRLGWRGGADLDGSERPARELSHAPILQGRVSSGSRAGVPPRARRADAEAAWAALPVLAENLNGLAPRDGRAPAYGRGTAVGVAMDQLRAQLVRVCQAEGWRRVGISSPDRGAGRSYVTAALATSIARLDSPRVLVIDADLVAPGLDAQLGLPVHRPLSDLFERDDATGALARVGDSMVVALNDMPVGGAAEHMHQPDRILAWREMIDLVAPDLVLLDMPPLLKDTVTQSLLPQVDAILLISDGLRTKPSDILECERMLEGQVPLIGVVLNKSEDRDSRPRARARR